MKHVLITGAALRVGREIALHLASKGWDVTLHYRHSKDQAEELTNQIRKLGQVARLVRADLERPDEIETMFENAPYPFTDLVNNASLFEHDVDDPNGLRHMQVNYQAPLRLTELLFAQLPPDENGSVVHLLDNTPCSHNLTSYIKSRATLKNTLPEQAKKYAPRLRINAVALGATLKNPNESEDHFNQMIADSPLRCPSMPQDVARVVRLLLETPSITGQIINVDGGFHLK